MGEVVTLSSAVMSEQQPSQSASSGNTAASATRVALPVTDSASPIIGLACRSDTAGLRVKAALLTYAQCSMPVRTLLEHIAVHRSVTGLLGVRETHSNGGYHVHVYVQKSPTLLTWDSLTVPFEGSTYRPNIRTLSTMAHRYNAYQYLFKENEPETMKSFEPPEQPRNRNGVSSSQELLELAQASTVDAALQRYIQEGGELSRVSPVQKGITNSYATTPTSPEVGSRLSRNRIKVMAISFISCS